MNKILPWKQAHIDESWFYFYRKDVFGKRIAVVTQYKDKFYFQIYHDEDTVHQSGLFFDHEKCLEEADRYMKDYYIFIDDKFNVLI